VDKYTDEIETHVKVTHHFTWSFGEQYDVSIVFSQRDLVKIFHSIINLNADEVIERFTRKFVKEYVRISCSELKEPVYYDAEGFEFDKEEKS